MSQQPERTLINVPEWITITDAQVPPGTEYWFLSKVEYQDDQKSGGTHHIYAEEPHDPSAKIVVSNGQEEWKISLDKPTSEPAGNYPMWAHNYYTAWMGCPVIALKECTCLTSITSAFICGGRSGSQTLIPRKTLTVRW